MVALKPRRDESDEMLDQVDVPATVVCATCGDAECLGCIEERTKSGVVSIVAWERNDNRVWARLWATARATTRSPEAFFELLPDGPVLPAVRFALLSELIAATSMLAVIAGFVVAAYPPFLRELWSDPDLRALLARVLLVGLPSFALFLVLAHAVHGLSIDLGARRAGGEPRFARALRFGLYATGWDLVLGPVGLVVVGLREGGAAVVQLFRDEAMRLHVRSARAFLKGTYRIEGDLAKKPLRVAMIAAIAASLAGAVGVLVAAAALWFYR